MAQCPTCGAPVGDTDQFCASCGSFIVKADPQPAQTSFSSYNSYVDDDYDNTATIVASPAPAASNPQPAYQQPAYQQPAYQQPQPAYQQPQQQPVYQYSQQSNQAQPTPMAIPLGGAAVGAAAGANAMPGQTYPSQPYAGQPMPGEQEYPGLANWKTNVLFSVLGFIVGMLPNVILRSGSIGTVAAFLAIYAIIIVMCIFNVVYLLIYIPRVYKANAKPISSTLCSFLNCFSCALLGLLINYNFTKRKKGICHIVLGVLNVLVLIANFYTLGQLLF